MTEKLSYSMAIDLLFNGQDMDYCERPLSLNVFGQMALFDTLSKRANVGVIGPGGGRLVKSLAERGYVVDAYEGRKECFDHLQSYFRNNRLVRILPMKHLNEPTRRSKMKYEALICLDDLRAFRSSEAWTEEVQRIVKPNGYFVYSQVSNQLPAKKHTLEEYFDQMGNYNVSEETSKLILESYESLDDWDPGYDNKYKEMAKRTLGMLEQASSLRRNIRSGVEVRFMVWQRMRDAA